MTLQSLQLFPVQLNSSYNVNSAMPTIELEESSLAITAQQVMLWLAKPFYLIITGVKLRLRARA